MQNIGALESDITAAYSNDATLTLDEYLSNLAIYTGRIDEEDRNAVTLSTVHTAKGMEYPVVFVSGLYEDTFPSMRSVMESGKEGMEEERRLMYVAMTRAKDLLFLTWNTGYMYSQQGNRIPSQFIDEIPDTLTAHMRRPGPVPELSDLEQEKRTSKRRDRPAKRSPNWSKIARSA
ncbi:3'-5' exonuclease [Allobaculum sp. Allo2]|uniref:3'-5' exonuclease n=1 Tax=Allobaculum sp. Allo2 TaxID=2853432 RepID=UPI001F60A6C7|nr:ATP-dependent helicase [Allobaculum sp. Allo2]